VIANAQGTNAGVYTVSVTNAGGCVNFNTVSVVVNPQPVITPTNTGPYCAGATIQLSVAAYNTYTWAGPNAFISNLQNPTIGNAQIVNAGVYNVTVTAVGGCMSTGSTTVVINPLPTPTANVNTPICANQSASFTGLGGNTYTWSGPGAFTSNLQNPTIASAQASNTGVYTLNVTGANSCTNTTTVSLTVNPLPVIAVNSPTVCLGSNIALTSSGGNTYSWSGPNAFTSNLQNPTLTNAQFNMSGGYTVVVTTALGCTASAVANASVIPTPTAGILSNTPCVGATLSFTGSGGAVYTWSGPAGFSSNLQNPAISNVQLTNAGTYTLLVTAGSCTNQTTSNITINALPSPTAASNSAVCLLQPISLIGSGGVSYSWSGPNGYTSNQQSPIIATAQNTNAGTYTLVVTGANSCTNITTTPVVVNPLPNIATSDLTVCLNQPINLTSSGANTYTWSGPNAYTSNLQSPSIPSAQFNMSGQYTVTGTSAQGCTNSAVSNVTVIGLPNPVITSNTPCVGSVLNLSGTGGAVYSWSGPNGFTSNQQSPAIPNAQLINAGVYTLIATAGTCSNQATANIIVNALPSPTAASNSPVCLHQAINLTGSGGTTYTWAGPGGFTSNAQSTAIAVAQNTNAGTYTLTVTDNNSCSNTTVTTVVVNPLPTINTNNPSNCVNTTINLIAAGANSYTWTGPNNFTSNSPSPGIPFAQLNMAGPYTVTGTSAQGCSNTAVANVQVIPLPTPTIASNAPLCIGGNLSISAGGGNSYYWMGPNSFTSTSNNPTFANAQPSVSGVYTLIATVGACTNVTTQSIVVNPLPTPSLTSNSPVCLQSAIYLMASGGNNYVWTGPNGFNATGNNPVIGNAGNTSAGVYTAVATDPNGCVNTATVSVSINPLPIIAAAGSTLCADQTMTLGASGGTVYSWMGPNGFSSNSQSIQMANATVDMAGNYTVTATDQNGCSSTNICNVIINAIPTITVSANSPVCASGTIHLTASSGAGNGFIWNGPNGYSSVFQNSDITDAQSNAAGMYTVTVTDNLGCLARATVAMLINPLPQVSISSDKIKGCVPLCINFTPQSTIPLQSCLWRFGDGSSATGTSNIANCYKNAGSYKIYSDFTDIHGCANTGTFNVEAYPIPVADFNYSPSRPTESEQVEFLDASHDANVTSWTWSFSDLSSQAFITPSVPRAYENAGNYAIALIVVSDHGCRDTIVKSITIGEDFGIYVPDAFSPNGDGINDTFQPKGYGITRYELNIFDRWGEKLFTTKDFNQGWNGSYKANDIVKEDVYVWRIVVTDNNGKQKELSGKVALIK
jgi:gliding motility-associated-like protein